MAADLWTIVVSHNMNTVCLSDRDLYRKTSIQNGSTAFMYIVQVYKDLVFFFSMDAQERFERFVELCCLICAWEGKKSVFFSLEEMQFNPSVSHPKADRNPDFPRQGPKPTITNHTPGRLGFR